MKFFQTFFLFLIVLVNNNCFTVTEYNTDIIANEVAIKSIPAKSKVRRWKEISLPIEQPLMLISKSNDILVVGKDGIVKIGEKDELQKLSFNSQSSEYLTSDGGLSFPKHKVGNDYNKVIDIEPDKLCDIDTATILNNRLVALGTCEHTSQLWSFNLTDNPSDKSYIINYTYSTYPNADVDDPVYGPINVTNAHDKIFLPSNLKTGPALLEISENPLKPKIIWKGNENDGVILSFDLIQNEGAILTSNGKLFISDKNLKNWTLLSKISQDIADKAWQLKFLNRDEGFLIGQDGLLLYSSDGGKNWNPQVIDTRKSLYKIVTDNSQSVIMADFKSIFAYRAANDWENISLDENRRVDDIALNDGKIFVLCENKVFVTEY